MPINFSNKNAQITPITSFLINSHEKKPPPNINKNYTPNELSRKLYHIILKPEKSVAINFV